MAYPLPDEHKEIEEDYHVSNIYNLTTEGEGLGVKFFIFHFRR